MNAKEVVEIIREAVVDNDQDPDPDYGTDYSKLEAAGFKISEEEREGGEGEGESYHVVLKLENAASGTIFVKCDAYYASYEGTNWADADVYQVEPKEVKAVEWAKV